MMQKITKNKIEMKELSQGDIKLVVGGGTASSWPQINKAPGGQSWYDNGFQCVFVPKSFRFEDLVWRDFNF